MLEKQIAAILISEIVNYDVDESKETDDKLHQIPVKKVYSQLVTNNVVSLKHLSKKTTANEKKVYDKYKNSVAEAVRKLKSDLNGSGTAYNDYKEEFQAYCDYIYDLLKNDGILIASSIDTDDSTYKKYIDGKISINEFIKYAIKKNWISLENLNTSSDYSWY